VTLNSSGKVHCSAMDATHLALIAQNGVFLIRRSGLSVEWKYNLDLKKKIPPSVRLFLTLNLVIIIHSEEGSLNKCCIVKNAIDRSSGVEAEFKQEVMKSCIQVNQLLEKSQPKIAVKDPLRREEVNLTSVNGFVLDKKVTTFSGLSGERISDCSGRWL